MSASLAATRNTEWWAAFAHPGFRLYQGSRLLSVVGSQMQSVAIGWQIYAVTGRPLDLAWVGLAQFFPAVLLSPVTGHVADRFERRRVLMGAFLLHGLMSLALFAVARREFTSVTPIYAVLVGVGAARAFQGPAGSALMPSLVPVEHFRNAVAWSSSLWQAATVVGPALGGLAYAAFGGPSLVYACAAMGSFGAFACVALIRPVRVDGDGTSAALPRRGQHQKPAREPLSLASLMAGVRYVRENEVLLGAISLDLFAVLLGGATALLPVYAHDILHLGPVALGALRAAPAVGAAVTGFGLALRPIESRAGAKMLACVAMFGAATIVFGLSRSLPLSLAALFVIGASDMVSVIVRSALVQLETPDAMRGRVSAVNMVFVGASNELGEFESGVTAQLLGVVPAVVLGGVGTLVVVALWAWRFPKLRGWQ
jgi:MFS family permease